MKTKTAVAAVIGLAIVQVVCAQTPGVAEAPKLLVGDKWEFAATARDGAKTAWSREVVETPSPNRLRVKYEAGGVGDFDAAMNFMPEGKPEYARTLVRYPLKVGDEWTVARKFPNPSTSEDGKARVVAVETVTVPAGTFQCYRVEAQAGLTGARGYSERRQWIRWYCPDVKWIGKETLETITFNPYNPAASGTVTTTSELVKFTPGK